MGSATTQGTSNYNNIEKELKKLKGLILCLLFVDINV